MKFFLKSLFLVSIVFTLYLASWFVQHGDIDFSTDIARDFFLLEELHQKTIVLIGPKSSTGLFHGPLWTYLNYPAYAIGHGNPVIVGWFWILLIIGSLILSFLIAKKLFNTTTAYLFTLMVAEYCVFHAKGLYNPHGAMFLLPAFFYFFIRYLETHKLKHLFLHIFVAACVIQFQMAVGIPFLILSFLYIAVNAIKFQRKKHLLSFFLILIPLGNFLLFDLRHQFILSHNVVRYLTSATQAKVHILITIKERIILMMSGIELLRRDPGGRNFVLTLILLAFLFVQVRDNKYKRIYLSFLYFYGGFFLLSFVNIWGILYFYFFPLFPLVFLIFSSFVTSRYKYIFLLIFFAIFAMNLNSAIDDMQIAEKTIIGKSIYSWKFLDNAASQIFHGHEKEFGYFVYAPNVVAFEGKYAMMYEQKRSLKKAYYFGKKPVTYLLIAPPPWNNPYMNDEWWKINQMKILNKPEEVTKFENGYKIEKLSLSEEDTKVTFDPNIDPGLHFR